LRQIFAVIGIIVAVHFAIGAPHGADAPTVATSCGSPPSHRKNAAAARFELDGGITDRR
jgi:hypothetical protein